MKLIEDVNAAHEAGYIKEPINLVINGIRVNAKGPNRERDSILSAFVWHETPEGSDFWDSVYYGLQDWRLKL